MNTEGTYILSGIIQGPLPPGPDGREQLQQFSALLETSGILLSLRVDGGNFSLLAEDRVVETNVVFASEIEDNLKSALTSLLDAFPEGMRMSLMSTIRSRIFIEGREHQAVYAVVFPGIIQVESAVVKSTLLPRARKFTFKHKAIFAFSVCLLLGLSVWLSSRWVDYSPIKQQFTLMVKGNKLEDIHLNTAALGDVIKIEKDDISSLRGVLKLKVTRGSGWVTKADGKENANSPIEAAIYERRHLKVSYFDVTGNIVTDRSGRVVEKALPIAGLISHQSISVEVILPEGYPISEIVITP
jgi:hypothetical protein